MYIASTVWIWGLHLTQTLLASTYSPMNKVILYNHQYYYRWTKPLLQHKNNRNKITSLNEKKAMN